MLDTPADMQTDSEEPEPSGESKVSWERSSIGFPYAPLAEGLEVAMAIQGSVGTGTMSDDQLAPAISMSHKSSGYRTKISAARMFGLIEPGDGGHRLTDLGKRVVDEKQARAAKADAFLNVPLYRRVYEEHKGSTIPPAAALEREFLGFGVAPKQTTRARQVFERSAEQAGYFEVGRDRLVRPTVKQGEGQDDHEEKKPKHRDDDGGDGTGNSVLDALVSALPKEGVKWPASDRVHWLTMVAMAMDMAYGKADAIIVSSKPSAPPPPPSQSLPDVLA